MSEELKPCPFCGGNARLTTWTPTAASISCIMCGAHFNTYTEAEAIAAWNARATLGSDEPPYDVLLRCLENDWHISASWDGLRKFWCIELTEEGVKLRDAAHGTLTADQVREVIERNFSKVAVLDNGKPVEWRDDWVCKIGVDYRAIADELNAALGSGECKIYRVGNTQDVRKCSACGKLMHFNHPLDRDCLNFCPNCGSRVVE